MDILWLAELQKFGRILLWGGKKIDTLIVFREEVLYVLEIDSLKKKKAVLNREIDLQSIHPGFVQTRDLLEFFFFFQLASAELLSFCDAAWADK